MNILYHPYLLKSVERIVTLIESKGAIYRGMYKTSTTLIEDYLYIEPLSDRR